MSVKDDLMLAANVETNPKYPETLLDLLCYIPHQRQKAAQDAVKKISGRQWLFHGGTRGVPMTEQEARDLIRRTAESL
jgi:hypothetical protein